MVKYGSHWVMIRCTLQEPIQAEDIIIGVQDQPVQRNQVMELPRMQVRLIIGLNGKHN